MNLVQFLRVKVWRPACLVAVLAGCLGPTAVFAAAPIATNDVATDADEDSLKNISIAPLLSNDSGTGIGLSSVGSPSVQGAVVTLSGGTISYDPRGSASAQALRVGQSVTDSFTYAITNSDGSSTATVTLNLQGRNDLPQITGAVKNQARDDTGTNLFAAITVSDVDIGDTLTATIRLSSLAIGWFAGHNGQTDFTLTGSAAEVTTALRALRFDPRANRVAPGTSETVDVTLELEDAAGADSPGNSVTTLTVTSIDDPPFIGMEFTWATYDDQVGFPLYPLVVGDPDADQNSQFYSIRLLTSLYGRYDPVSVPSSRVDPDGSILITNYTRAMIIAPTLDPVRFVPEKNVGGNYTSGDLRQLGVVITDSRGTALTSSIPFIIVPVNDLPNIAGVSPNLLRVNDDATIQPFDQILLSDIDESGNQSLSATISYSFSTNVLSPGTFALSGGMTELRQTNLAGIVTITYTVPLAGQASVQSLVRSLVFTPTPNALPVGETRTILFTITITDSGGKSRSNAKTQLAITSINGAPEITTTPEPPVQPFPVSPRSPIQPFRALGVTVTDDDSNLTVTVSLDQASKGDLYLPISGTNSYTGIVNETGLARVSATGHGLTNGSLVCLFGGDPFYSGVYVVEVFDANSFTIPRPYSPTASGTGSWMSVQSFTGLAGSPADITMALRSLVFAVNPSYLFPPDAPGGTAFTIQARDAILNTGTRTLAITLQEAPRNWLVTRSEDDAQPGSLRYVLNRINENREANAVVTFALPKYPALIRLTNTFVLTRNVVFKGPGADLLSLSGDEDDNGQPDHQIFRVFSAATFEGLTLTRGKGGQAGDGALSGGAIYVGPQGRLRLSYCAITDSQAVQWGGAIDVNLGSLELDHCLLRGNTTAEAGGLGGGAISLFTDRACSIINTTFSGNRQRSAGGFGGGALYAESSDPIGSLPVVVEHCTFAENQDAAAAGSSIHANVFGTEVSLRNSIFADAHGKNLEVSGAASIESAGGNLSDDATRTILTQDGQPKAIYLLDQSTDRTNATTKLGVFAAASRPTGTYPLITGSPAIGQAVSVAEVSDQRGGLRDNDPDSGAAELPATLPQRVVINEIHFDPQPGEAQFVELYVPRDSAPMDLTGFSLWVDGTNRYNFPASSIVQPGRGLVIANKLVAAGSVDNPTTVVTNVTGGTLALRSRGSIEIRTPGADPTALVQVDYVGQFVDPLDELNETKFRYNSLTLAPQFVGFAFVPHRIAAAPPLGGVNVDDAGLLTFTSRTNSPGRDTGNTPFGSPNAFPIANADSLLVSEDIGASVGVLVNDLDADGFDRLVVVDVSAATGPGVGSVTTNLSLKGAAVRIDPAGLLQGTAVIYDPRLASALQRLPEGAEATDEFYYEVLDLSTGPITQIQSAGGGTQIRLTSPVHRLAPGVRVVVSGTAIAAYNGELPVISTNADSFVLTVPFNGGKTITEYQSLSNGLAVRVVSANHGLAASGRVLLTGTGLAAYNAAHEFTRLDASSFAIPVAFAGNPAIKGSWSPVAAGAWAAASATGPVQSYAGTAGSAPVTVQSPAHSLVTGDRVLISGAAIEAFNGDRAVTRINANTFSVPATFRAGQAIQGYESTNSGAAVLVISTNHGLAASGRIVVSGAGTAAYNGERSFVRVNTNTFLLSIAFAGNPPTKGAWAPVDSGQWVLGARGPTERSEARVSVTVLGANDAPIPGPDIVTTDEETLLRIMADPALVGTTTVFDTDAQYPARPHIFSPLNLLQNDVDPDTDDTSGTLQVIGIMGSVQAIAGFAGSPGASPVIVTSPGHGLADGIEILVAGYSGHPSYNGFHPVTVIDADTFSIPVEFIAESPLSLGSWTILNDGNRLAATSQLGAAAKLEIRTDRAETSIVYNPRASAYLNGLGLNNGVPEVATDRLYYAVQDSHGAIGIASLSVSVSGVNDLPNPVDDPTSLGSLGNSTNLPQFISQLDVQYHLEAASGTSNRVDAQVQWDAGSALLADLWITMEDRPLTFAAADIVSNDTDVDRIDKTLLSVKSVSALSHEGATVTLSPDRRSLLYNPTASAKLNKLAREETVMDSFSVTVTDGANGTVTNLVAVLVVGVNDTPRAVNDVAGTPENVPLVLGPNGNSVIGNDVEDDINGAAPDNELRLVPVTNVLTTAGAAVTTGGRTLIYDPSVSAFLDGLAQGESFVDSYRYTVTDGSLLFANDDLFRVKADGADFVLGVLANDNNLNGTGSAVRIVSLGVPNHGGSVKTNAADTVVGNEVLVATPGTVVVYTPPVNFVGDEVFTYTIVDAAGNLDQGLVTVRVTVDPLNGHLQASADHFTVAKGQSVLLDVLANDNVLPESSAGFTITQLFAPPSLLARLSVEAGQVRYTPDAAFGSYPTNEIFSYEISGGGSARAIASVSVLVVNRDGKLDVRGDAFSLLANSQDNPLDVLANDNLLPGSTSALTVLTINVPPSHGGAVINPAGNGLLYTPAAGFVGQDTLTYVATDGLGGTGTGVVQIAVGNLATANDFFAVPYDDPALSTDDGVADLDVLVNDRSPGAGTNVTLLSVSPSSTVLGSMTVRTPDRTRLRFNPAPGQQGEQEFTYAITDGFGRSATGKVMVVVVTEGVQANPDYFSVLRNSAGNELDVLANDAAIPNLGRKLAIVSIGTGLDVPNRGGTVELNPSGDRLLYTPAAGFTGEETFTCTVSDSRRTDTAKVVIRVSAGELSANADAFTVFYELPEPGAGPREFTLPVLGNDRVLPDLGQLLTVTGVGIDDVNATNAPSHRGTVQIGADAASLTYIPGQTNGFPYTERFTYEISDGTARRAQATVQVTVQQRTNIRDLETDDDTYAVAANSQKNAFNVLANDGVKPASAASWSITSIPQPPVHGVVVISGGTVLYTPQSGFIGTDTFVYAVSDNLGGTGTGEVTVKVGDLPVQDDGFVVLSGSSSNALDVLANDAVRPATAGEFKLFDAFGANRGGAVAAVPGAGGFVYYTPSAAYAGTYPYVETFAYRVVDDASGAVTGRVAVTVFRKDSDRSNAVVSVTVTGVNDAPTITGTQAGQGITDKETIQPFANVVVADVDSQGLQLLTNVTVSLDDPDKGLLENLGSFVRTSPGVYQMSGTGAQVTTALRGLLFIPRENRPTVPLPATTRFTISVADGFVTSPVTDDVTTVIVTPVNDAPTLTGTLAGQKVYAHLSLLPFVGVTVADVDDDLVQPQGVIVALDEPTHGYFTNLGGFAPAGSGTYSIVGVTPAQVTTALRGLIFVPTPGNRLSAGGSETTRLTITVNDGFAPPVVDALTTVISLDSFVKQVNPTNAPGTATFGFSVAALRDLVVVGAITDNGLVSRSGAAYLFGRNAGGTDAWGQTRKLQAADGALDDQFGYAVSISADTVVVGAPYDITGSDRLGSIYIFERNTNGPNAWGQSKKIVPTDGAWGDFFGGAVSIQGDTILVGAAKHKPGARRSGAAYLYGRNQGAPGAWGLIKKIAPADGADSDDFGVSVALDGNTAAVGARYNAGALAAGSKAGAVYLFERNFGGANQWGQSNKVVVADAVADANLGHAVALRGDLLVVGAPGDTPNGLRSGSAYAFSRHQGGAGRWGQVNKFAQFDAVDSDDQFGFSVTVDGELVAVGSRLDSHPTHPQGAVYVFVRDYPGLDQWSFRERIAPVQYNGDPDDGFVVALQQNTLAVGARIGGTTQNGGAFIYRLKFGNAPFLAQPIPDQHVVLSNLFNFSIAGAFADPDAADAVALSLVTSAPFTPPAWPEFSFNPLTGVFAGRPIGTAAIYPLKVQATDSDGATASATFNLVVENPPPALLDWYARYFAPDTTSLPGLEATLWGDNADPDLDGLSNRKEYLFGSNPLQANPGDHSPVHIAPGTDPGTVTVSFLRPLDDPRLTYSLEVLDSSNVWQPASALVLGGTQTPVGDGLALVNWRVQNNLPLGQTQFLRVRVQIAGP